VATKRRKPLRRSTKMKAAAAVSTPRTEAPAPVNGQRVGLINRG
jgi:hypothetical protein